jgi:glycosyltransferase involved in cell wall biosynthesis
MPACPKTGQRLRPVRKIYINGKFFSQRITGTQRYARELLNQFDQLLFEVDERLAIEVLVPRSVVSMPPFKKLIVRGVGRMSGTSWEQIELPHYCKGHLLFTLSGGAPLSHSRNVVTIHDAAVMAVPSGYSLPYRLWHRNVCRRMAHLAEHIFTNSNFSKGEIVNWYGAQPEKISVVYLGSDHFARLASDRSALQRFGISGKYILAVSSHNPNKNFHRIVAAMQNVNDTGMQIVIAGGAEDRVYRSMKLPEAARILGYVSDVELKALYENASCFVFPSLYEGFGLPPLEAMSTGCPVVVSRVGAMPELFQGTAFFCDPYDPVDIASAIQQAVRSARPTATELKAFAGKFNWAKCARQTLEVIKTLV